LGAQPLANSYHKGETELPNYPLAVQVCENCFHSQLTVAVNPDLLYKHYLYVSGTSRTLTEYFRWFVDRVETDLSATNRGLPADRQVLDIASNDGSLLAEFIRKGWSVQGVDPAENLRELSAEKGVPTLCAYWGEETSRKLCNKYDVIVAQNVLAHLPYPVEFLRACKESLNTGGRVYIQTSQSEMFRNNEFDTIYHEHHSFFCSKSFDALAKRADLNVIDLFKVPVHGTSYVVVLSKDEKNPEPLRAFIEQERSEGRYDLQMYRRFAENAHRVAVDLKRSVEEHRSRGMKVVGFGAAAKGNTLLNFGQIRLDYIVDDNPLKWGLLTPGMNTPIKSPDELADENRALALVVLAWNFFDEIRDKIKRRRPIQTEDVFIKYFPVLSVHS
jgi:SAM-dependent methyltransferase